MKNIHLKMNEADAGNGSGTGAAPQVPEYVKTLEANLKKMTDGLSALSNKVESIAKEPAKKASKEQEDDGESLETMILVDPAKAVKKITANVTNQVMNSVSSETAAKEEFQLKFAELNADFPELSNQNSELYTRAKEILDASTKKSWDAPALDRAVLKAAAEKGVLPVKHRKKMHDDDAEGDDGYLGGSSYFSSDSRQNRRQKADKLPAATLAFAEAMGMNTKDPKVVERLTKRHQDRRGNWNKYR